jgi:hypothetical protein
MKASNGVKLLLFAAGKLIAKKLNSMISLICVRA